MDRGLRMPAPEQEGNMGKIDRFQVGEGTVTVLRDGEDRFGVELFGNLPAGEAARLLQQAGMEPDAVPIPVSAFLYQVQDRTVLIDAGGGGIIPVLGALSGALAQAGVRPEEVDTVFCTHLHPDHIGGLMRDGEPVFTQANLWVHQDEIAFWTNPDIRNGAPEEARPFFDAAGAVLEGYRNQLHPFSGAVEVAPAADTVPLPGHTPGHTGLQIGGVGTGVLLWGDIVHAEALQLPRPETTIAFDVDPDAAAETRREILLRVSRDGMRVAGNHLSGPGFGTIRRATDGYEFIPIET